MMKISIMAGSVGVALFAAVTRVAAGQVATVDIGTKHFADGQKIGTGTFLTAVSGQPAPFDQFYGSDATGPNFSANWTMSWAPVQFTSATLSFGIFDHDSKASGDQVSLFTVGGVDMTSVLNAAFEAHGGANGEYDVYTLTLPHPALVALGTGSLSVDLALQGPGLSVLGETSFNGAGLDFAELVISVPEPTATPFIFGAGIGLIGFWLKRRRN
jgi:hypothetical protein